MPDRYAGVSYLFRGGGEDFSCQVIPYFRALRSIALLMASFLLSRSIVMIVFLPFMIALFKSLSMAHLPASRLEGGIRHFRIAATRVHSP
jgi:hypothetical protein